MGRDWCCTGQVAGAPQPRRPHTPRAASRSRQVAVGAVPLSGAVVLLATAAGAFWTTTGTGSGTSAAATALPLTTTVATVTGTLYPGATADLALTIRNPNPFPVTVTAVAGSGVITASGGAGTCTTTGVTFTDRTGLSLVVPARAAAVDGSLTTALTAAVTMSNASDSGCQGATFTVPVTLTGGSSAP